MDDLGSIWMVTLMFSDHDIAMGDSNGDMETHVKYRMKLDCWVIFLGWFPEFKSHCSLRSATSDWWYQIIGTLWASMGNIWAQSIMKYCMYSSWNGKNSYLHTSFNLSGCFERSRMMAVQYCTHITTNVIQWCMGRYWGHVGMTNDDCDALGRYYNSL